MTGRSRTGLELARAKHALSAAGLDPDTPLVRASSVTNEVWLGPDIVIRVNRRLDRRLRREARLAHLLPPEVHYPDIIKYGAGTGFDFLIQRRRPGDVLSRAWPNLTQADRRLAVRQLTAMLRALHETPFPSSAPAVDFAPQMLEAQPGVRRVEALLGALDKVRSFEHVDAELIATLIAYVKATANVLEPYPVSAFIHGDLTFENVLWDGTQVTALIDFEWARGAPSDLELDVLLRFCAYPFLHVAADYEDVTKAEDYEDVPFWMKEDYPALFAWPHALDRLRLYSIAYDVRALVADPPMVSARDLSEHHALRRLSRTIAQRSYLDAFAHPEQRI